MQKKGIEVEYMFLIGGLVLILLFVSYWQQMGTSLAAKNWGELKVQTITQVKNVILLMQKAPVESETCVPVTGCDKIAIHAGYVEIWGGENEYFKEPSYLSTALSTGMLDIYAKNGTGVFEPLKKCEAQESNKDWGDNCWDLDNDGVNDKVEDKNSDGKWDSADCKGQWNICGFITPCGSGNSILFICFKKQLIEAKIGEISPNEELYVEYPAKSGIYRKVSEVNAENEVNLAGTHRAALLITRQTDISKV